MTFKLNKTVTAFIFAGLCFSSSYPLTETAAANWAWAIGLCAGAGTGVGAGFLSTNSPDISRNAALGIGAATGIGVGALSGYALYKILYQYTPKPVIKNAKSVIKRVQTDTKFAQNFITLSPEGILNKVKAMSNKKTTPESLLNQFNQSSFDVANVIRQLENIKNDLDSNKLRKTYEKISNEADKLKSYLNIRLVLMTIALAISDKLLNLELGTQDTPLFCGTCVTSVLCETMEHFNYINNKLDLAQKCLCELETTKNTNPELKIMYYPLEMLTKILQNLKNISKLRYAQSEALYLERLFASNDILARQFISEHEITLYLNAHSSIPWPLIIARQKLNTELEKCIKSSKSASALFDAFDPNQIEYRKQSTEVVNKFKTMINIIETNLRLIVQSNDYVRQVNLYEQYLEQERQRVERERLRLELERQRLERERQQREFEKSVQQILTSASNGQPHHTGYHPTHGTHATTSSTPTHVAPTAYTPVAPSAPSYEAVHGVPPAYTPVAPSAPSYAAVYGTPPAYTPTNTPVVQYNTTETLPPPPSYDSLYPTK